MSFNITSRYFLSGTYLYNLSIGLLTLVYFFGILVPIMEPDAAIYALISMEMSDGNFSEITCRGLDWLDKPHFQFWITSIVFKIFGISGAGYKLTSLFIFLLGVIYTYKYGKKFYSHLTGVFAAIILMTSWHIIISNNDVRAEPILTGFTIISLYYFASYLKEKKLFQLVIGSFFIGLLIMTKGIFAILPVAGGVLFSLIIDKKWKEIFHWQWLLTIAFALFFISPSIWAYYQQFDVQPDKVVFGESNVSGVKFFLWDSQWGRFSNTGPIKGKGDLFFFLHTLLWAAAPWGLLAFAAIYAKIKSLIGEKAQTENLTLSGFLFLFIIISISSFQLPHYINSVLPLMAILISAMLFGRNLSLKFLNAFKYIQGFQILLVAVLIILSGVLFFEELLNIDTLLNLIIVHALIIALFLRSKSNLKTILFASVLSILSLNYFMNRDFYPKLLSYQSESEAAFYIQKEQLDVKNLYLFFDHSEDTYQNCTNNIWAFDFYLGRTFPQLNEYSSLNDFIDERILIFTRQAGYDAIIESGRRPVIIKEFDDFPVTVATQNLDFINKKNRASTLGKSYLLELDK